MDKKTFMEKVKGMSREERAAFFQANKAGLELVNTELEKVTAGSGLLGAGNPTSSYIDEHGNWFTSQGYTCGAFEIYCG